MDEKRRREKVGEESFRQSFVKKNNYQSEVIHLSDVNANKWIDKVSAEWSGAIPATLIYNKNKRTFIEGKITYNELDSLIKQHL